MIVPRRAAGGVFAALILVAISASTASSQGPLPLSASAYAEPISLTTPSIERKLAGEPGGHFSAYCVRLCDGRYFPLQRSFSISPAEHCRAMCPTATTTV